MGLKGELYLCVFAGVTPSKLHVRCVRRGRFFVYLLRPQDETYDEASSLYPLDNDYNVSWCSTSRNSSFILECISVNTTF